MSKDFLGSLKYLTKGESVESLADLKMNILALGLHPMRLKIYKLQAISHRRLQSFKSYNKITFWHWQAIFDGAYRWYALPFSFSEKVEGCIFSKVSRVIHQPVRKPMELFLLLTGVETLCDNVTTPDNGSVVVSGYSESSTATFSCDEGYSLNGSEILHCGSDGQWSQDEPTCEGQ